MNNEHAFEDSFLVALASYLQTGAADPSAAHTLLRDDSGLQYVFTHVSKYIKPLVPASPNVGTADFLIVDATERDDWIDGINVRFVRPIPLEEDSVQYTSEILIEILIRVAVNPASGILAKEQAARVCKTIERDLQTALAARNVGLYDYLNNGQGAGPINLALTARWAILDRPRVESLRFEGPVAGRLLTLTASIPEN